MMSRWRIGKGAGQVVRDKGYKVKGYKDKDNDARGPRQPKPVAADGRHGKSKESFAEFMDSPDITWLIVTATAKGTMERTMGVTKITC